MYNTEQVKVAANPEIWVLREFTVYDADKLITAARRALDSTPQMSGRNFVDSVVSFYNTKGFMSPRQYYVLADILQKNVLATRDVTFPAPGVEQAFSKAIENKDKKVKVHINGYVLRYNFSTRHNAPYIAVYADEFGYVGAIAHGVFKATGKALAHSFDFSDLEDMLQNFHEAVRAYGHLTNNCGVCRRKLTDPVSVERGIGPVCEARMGW